MSKFNFNVEMLTSHDFDLILTDSLHLRQQYFLCPSHQHLAWGPGPQ
jgi:hypothetical protein